MYIRAITSHTTKGEVRWGYRLVRSDSIGGKMRQTSSCTVSVRKSDFSGVFQLTGSVPRTIFRRRVCLQAMECTVARAFERHILLGLLC